jgi:hypothetical protein
MISKKHPHNKLMTIAGLGFFVLFILFIISKNYLPDAGGGWSNPPIFDYLFLFGIGICLSISEVGLTYYTWKMNEEEYIEWYLDQVVFGKNWIRTWINFYPKSTFIWMYRILTLIGAVFGIALSGLMLFAIFKYIFGQI